MMTYEQARELFSYDPETGILRWIVPRRGKKSGVAGCPQGKGHLQVRVGYKKYYAHRIIWLWMTGAWPEEEVDHRDLDPGNNRWKNLREATKTQNRRNRAKLKSNISGYKGVTRNGENKWCARIRCEDKQYFLGNFDSPLAAHKAYCRAAKIYHGEFARTV